MNKVRVFLITYCLSISCVVYSESNTMKQPIIRAHYLDALSLCNKDQQQFLEQIEQLRRYYRDGFYERDLEAICAEAERYFAHMSVDNRSAIIFDVDDTAVISYMSPDKCFVWSDNLPCWDNPASCEDDPAYLQARQQKNRKAILPVLRLYKMLIARGFTIFFISARTQIQYHEYAADLSREGYQNYKELIMRDQEMPHQLWKLTQRKKIAENYDIVGCVGDLDTDFYGGFTGYIVRLPNHLYR